VTPKSPEFDFIGDVASNTDAVHSDRRRARSFGSIASDYDRYRPSYPDELIADLVAFNPTRALDIACGTGKVAVPLVACGVAVLGVEVDPKMAAVAESHGIFVDISSFEDWDSEGRTFDLVTCGQGWHWIDPVAGPLKVGEVLNPGGTFALFWNYDDMDADLQRAIDDAYRAHVPSMDASPYARFDNSEGERYLSDLRAAKVFDEIEVKRYRWEQTYSVDEWMHRAATHSANIVLSDDVRARLFDALRAILDSRGGLVDARFGTYTIFARTKE
jgi:SAM-dependent methyltransferase